MNNEQVAPEQPLTLVLRLRGWQGANFECVW